jgi:hypothetical protein
MRPSHTVARRLLAAALITLASACGSSTDANPIAGSYVATTFRVTPTGQSEMNILAQGGSLGITIAHDNGTSGTLFVPASATGDVAFTESMAGTAVQSGSTVTFTQSADTFVRNLTFSISGSTLQALNQTPGSATFTVILTRQ